MALARRASRSPFALVARLSLVGSLVGQAAACSAGGAATEGSKGPEAVAPKASASSASPVAPSASASAATPTPPASAAPSASASTPVSAPPAEEKKACPKGMALVAAGDLAMGTPKKKVHVDALCLDVNETTADEYAACVKAGKCSDTQLKCAPQATYGDGGKGNHPINCVDYAQANAYCKAQDKRLPTPEEWEFAARGAEGRTYPWGNDAPKAQACWSGAELHTGTCPVGATPAGDSPEGVHDLAGNVFEWTAPKVENSSTSRGGRGGSWKDGAPDLLRAARQGGFETRYRCGFLGIRCASPAGASETAAPAAK